MKYFALKEFMAEHMKNLKEDEVLLVRVAEKGVAQLRPVWIQKFDDKTEHLHLIFHAVEEHGTVNDLENYKLESKFYRTIVDPKDLVYCYFERVDTLERVRTKTMADFEMAKSNGFKSPLAEIFEHIGDPPKKSPTKQ
jgi:hypothetical protein